MNTFKITQLLADLVCFVNAVGHTSVQCLVGHDFGAFVTGVAAMARPDFFKSAVLLSHPFKGGPKVPFNVASPTNEEKSEQARQAAIQTKKFDPDVHVNLLKLDPPRKHYTKYNSTAAAAEDWYCGGNEDKLRAFLRGYIHLKSADWPKNSPHRQATWSAEKLQNLPHYYVMKADRSMPQTVEEDLQGEDANATKRWLPDNELDVYVREWKRTGFQGGLNWYRSNTDPTLNRDLNMWAGRKIECPAMLVNGSKDWGKYQRPGEMEDFDQKYTDFRGAFDIAAGHWPQQENPDAVVKLIADFLHKLTQPSS